MKVNVESEFRCPMCKIGTVRLTWPVPDRFPIVLIKQGVVCDWWECTGSLTVERLFDSGCDPMYTTLLPEHPGRAREADDETGRPPVPESAPPSSVRVTYQQWLDSRPLL